MLEHLAEEHHIERVVGERELVLLDVEQPAPVGHLDPAVGTRRHERHGLRCLPALAVVVGQGQLEVRVLVEEVGGEVGIGAELKAASDVVTDHTPGVQEAQDRVVDVAVEVTDGFAVHRPGPEGRLDIGERETIGRRNRWRGPHRRRRHGVDDGRPERTQHPRATPPQDLLNWLWASSQDAAGQAAKPGANTVGPPSTHVHVRSLLLDLGHLRTLVVRPESRTPDRGAMAAEPTKGGRPRRSRRMPDLRERAIARRRSG